MKKLVDSFNERQGISGCHWGSYDLVKSAIMDGARVAEVIAYDENHTQFNMLWPDGSRRNITPVD